MVMGIMLYFIYSVNYHALYRPKVRLRILH